jgi:hypothetical protein
MYSIAIRQNATDEIGMTQSYASTSDAAYMALDYIETMWDEEIDYWDAEWDWSAVR